MKIILIIVKGRGTTAPPKKSILTGIPSLRKSLSSESIRSSSMAISKTPESHYLTDSSSSTDTTPPPKSAMGSLRRRNTVVSVVPTKTHLEIPAPDSRPKSSSFPTGDNPFPSPDFEVVSFTVRPLAYTSLKDILANSGSGGTPSPKAVVNYNCRDISIRNHLVKQAAWAYLQPMASSPSCSDSHFFRRVWTSLSNGNYFGKPVSACIGFFRRHVVYKIVSFFDQLLGAFRRAGWMHAVL